MLKIYGYSDDLVEIEGAKYPYNEIDCFEQDVKITFTDGTKIIVGYSKKGMGVWWIKRTSQGSADQTLTICEDPDATPYSDILTIDSELKSVRVVSKRY